MYYGYILWTFLILTHFSLALKLKILHEKYFPKVLIDAAKTEIGSLTKIESLQVISGHSADFYPFEEASYFLQTEDKKRQQQIVLDWILSSTLLQLHTNFQKGNS